MKIIIGIKRIYNTDAKVGQCHAKMCIDLNNLTNCVLSKAPVLSWKMKILKFKTYQQVNFFFIFVRPAQLCCHGFLVLKQVEA